MTNVIKIIAAVDHSRCFMQMMQDMTSQQEGTSDVIGFYCDVILSMLQTSVEDLLRTM